MTGDEARWVIAHDLGINLGQHLSDEQMERVAVLRARGARWPLDSKQEPAKPSAAAPPTRPPTPQPDSPRSRFDARDFHPRVARDARRLFVDGHRTEAIRKAFQAVNNRVKRLAGTSRDGFSLMTHAFGGDPPPLAVNARVTESEQDEQQGMMHLFAGAVLSQRNPRTHEDDWEWDREESYALDCLSLASLLHRILDRMDP